VRPTALNGSPSPGAAAPPPSLTVAAVQAEAVPGDVAGNAARAAQLARITADQGATLAVLPELFLPAYHPPVLKRTATDVAADGAGRVADGRLDPLRAAARERGVVVVVGAAVRHPDGRRTCAALVVDRAGEVSAAYDKQHLCGPDEKALFTPGASGATLVVDGWRFGLGVCYDGCFPEHGRAAAVAGAHACVYPSGYVVGSEHRRDVYYAARALDNSMYVVFANSVGGVAPWRFNGGAAIYDPEGRPLERAPDEGERVVVATLDASEVDRVRAAHAMLAEHRPDQGKRRPELAA
jgi:predicted amidohydrolase